MHVVGHQYVSMNFGLVAMTHQIQQIQVGAIVVIDKEYAAAIVAALNNMKGNFWKAYSG
jgi:hypothetical protein